MKTDKTCSLHFLLWGVLLLALAGCSKDDPQPDPSGRKLISRIECTWPGEAPETISCSYDVSGRLLKISDFEGHTLTYAYAPGEIKVGIIEEGETMVFALDDAGYPVSMRNQGIYAGYGDFVYENGYLKSYTEYSGSDNEDWTRQQSLYTWVAGDLAKVRCTVTDPSGTSTTETLTCSYADQENRMNFDIFSAFFSSDGYESQVLDCLYGVKTTKSRHLIKKIESDAPGSERSLLGFSYEFDSSGYVTRAVVSSGTGETVVFKFSYVNFGG